MEILNRRLPENPFFDRLPGTRPVGRDEWLVADETYGAQMAYRDRLISERRDQVFRCDPSAGAAAREVLAAVVDLVLQWPGFSMGAEEVLRPDGVSVDLTGDHPLICAARLVQEDLCILQTTGGPEHVLTAAVLCFPASWSLEEKHMRALMSIHEPVVDYDERIGRGVQRMFDALKPGAVLCRGNLLGYHSPEIFTPRRENDRRVRPPAGEAPYLRAERQCLIRLPETDAVIFSIHTYMVRTDALEPDQSHLAQAAISRKLRHE